jgi:hypothetical protein
MHKEVSAAPCSGAQVFAFYPVGEPLKRQPRLHGAERRLTQLPVRLSGALAAAIWVVTLNEPVTRSYPRRTGQVALQSRPTGPQERLAS